MSVKTGRHLVSLKFGTSRPIPFLTNKYINMFFLSLLFSLYAFGQCTYNPWLASVAVNLSQSAYCSTWPCATCSPSNHLETVIEQHGERCLVGYNTDFNRLFVSFRGSTDLLNWIDDIQIRRIQPYNDSTVEVEQGFYKAYQYLKPTIHTQLAALRDQYQTRQLLLTGHSLGAALATVMAYDTMDTYDIWLVTFGSPRVGNPAFVQALQSLDVMYRVVHYYDIVPHTPEERLGYLHVPHEIWYDEANTHYVTCTDDAYHEDDACSNRCAPTHCTSTSDHLNYMGIPMGSSSNGLC
jgi:hypothetical protein